MNNATTALPPRLSIVIPCYNCAAYLPQTLESIRAYNGPHVYEVVLVNDGSTDAATKAYLKACEQEGAYKVVHRQNAGPAAARNAGIGHSSSEYILFLDSDNKLHADAFINGGIALLDNNPDVGVFYGRPAFFGDVVPERIFATGAFDFKKMLQENYIDMCSMVRRQAWQEVGGLDEARLLIGHEDWDFWLRIGRAGWRFHFEKEVLFDYRITPGSLVTQSGSAADYDRMVRYIYQKHYNVLPQHLKAWCNSFALQD